MKNTTLKRIFCIFMAVMLLLPAFSGLAFATDTQAEPIKTITNQPTSKNPTVETNDDGASYQWHYATSSMITNENALSLAGLPIAELLQGEPYYTEGVGWTPATLNVGSGATLGVYFQAEIKAGEELIVTFGEKSPLEIILLDAEMFVPIELEFDQIDASTVRFSGIEQDCNALLAAAFTYEPIILNAEIPSRGQLLDPVEGQTASTLTKQELGKSYACKVTFSDGSYEISSVISSAPIITKQPTITDPSISVSLEELATYKWFEVIYDYVEINLDNAQVFDVQELTGEEGASSYDSENGWTPIAIGTDGSFAHYYFIIDLKSGDKVKLNTLPNADMVALLTSDMSKTLTPDENNEITVTVDGLYALITYNGSGESVKAQVTQATLGEAVEGQTTNTLTKYDINKSYACLVTWTQDEIVIEKQSNQVDMIYTILKQPTPQKPTVEVSFKDDVEKYEWFGTEIVNYDVTDEKAAPYGEATYDSEYGWSGVDGSLGITFFTVKLNAGDTLILTSDVEIDRYGVILFGEASGINSNTSSGEYGEVAIKIDTTDSYTLIMSPDYEEVMIFASVLGSRMLDTAIEGQSTSTLTDFEKGEIYFAKVTYKDGTELISDALAMEYVITSQPSSTNPTVETNKNQDVKKYSWYKRLLSSFYEMKPSSGIVDGKLMVNEIYSGKYADGKWTVSDGYMNLLIQTEVGDTVRVTLNDDFDGEINYYYYDIFFEEQGDGSFTYTIGENDDTELDFEIYDYNCNPIEATIELIRDGKSYIVADEEFFDDKNGKLYPQYIYNGFYDGEQWISEDSEISVELELMGGCVIEIKPSEEFNGEIEAYGDIGDLSFTENNGVYSLTIPDGADDRYGIYLYDEDSEFAAEITVKKDGKAYEFAEKSPFNDSEMIYEDFDVTDSRYVDGAWISNDDTGELFIEIFLKKNSVVTIKSSEGFDGDIAVYSNQYENILQGENGVYTYVAKETGNHHIMAGSQNAIFSLSLYVQGAIYELVENQTEKNFKPSELGDYLVEVEFKDGTVLTSDVFEINSSVIFNTNGGTPLDTQAVAALAEIGKTEREGFILEGWYLDKELTEKAELPLNISGVVNLYAKWTKCDHKDSAAKPTCTEDVECTVCKADYKATGHSYKSNHTVSDEKHYFECSVCGAKQGEENHSFGEWSITKYAERKTQGEEKRACTVCGHTESRASEALGGMSNGAIVGIIIGSGAFLAMLAVGLWLILKATKEQIWKIN